MDEYELTKECATGKGTSCDGFGDNDRNDDPGFCECPCHEATVDMTTPAYVAWHRAFRKVIRRKPNYVAFGAIPPFPGEESEEDEYEDDEGDRAVNAAQDRSAKHADA